MTIRSRRSSLRFESLEQRALLAAVLLPGDEAESFEPVDVMEPVEQIELVELVEQFKGCQPPIMVICPGIGDGEEFLPWTPWLPPMPPDFVAEYDAFLAEHPDWLSDHGADGIQLMVMAPSTHLPWIELSTPGAARAFDAWYEQTYLQVFIDDPLFAVDEGLPLLDGEEPVVDFFDEEWLPGDFYEQGSDGAEGFEEEPLLLAALAAFAPEPRAAAFALSSAPAVERPWLATGFAFAQFSDSLAERPASGRPKQRAAPYRIIGG